MDVLNNLKYLIGDSFEWVDFVDSDTEKPFLSFIEHPKWLKKIDVHNTSLRILLHPFNLEVPGCIKSKIQCIPCTDPRNEFFQLIKDISDKIYSLNVSPKKVLKGKDCLISKTCIIEGYVKLGNNVKIGDYVVIKGDVIIGDNTVISDHVVIGADGFQINRSDTGLYDCNIPHFGSVHIGKNCKIGSFTNISKSLFSAPTKIGDNVFLDTFIHVAHNVDIGDNCVIAPMTTLSGGVMINDNVRIAPGVSINNKVRVHTDTFIGIGSVMIKSNKKSGTFFGIPAKSL